MACRNPDGTVENIARVEGSPEYVKMMRRLSDEASAHPSPPYSTAEDMWRDTPRQLVRSGRKAVGLPASSDVGVLASLLADLTSKAYDHTSQPVQFAVLAYPQLEALYEEDIVDAASYMGITALRGYHHHQPHELVAAYAGNGMGLCSDEYLNDPERCRNEGRTLPLRQVLSVSTTGSALILHTAGVREALDLANVDTTFSVLSGLDREDAKPFSVKARITRLLEKRYEWLARPSDMTVIISGDYGGDLRLHRHVEEAVRDLGPTPHLFADEPEFVAARGAAVLASRAQVMESGGDPDTSL